MKTTLACLVALAASALTSGCGDDRLIQLFTAIDDGYVATGNVPLAVSAGSGLLANDGDGEVTDFDAITSAGGTVSVGPDGDFLYSPPTGYAGVDTFGYENDGGLLASVTITVGDPVWFIDDTAPAGGDGSFAAPFDSLAAFNAANGGGGSDEPEAGDTIFLHEGSGTPYDGGIVLLDGQSLLGEGVNLVRNTVTIVPAGVRPVLTNSAGDGITLADANTIMGLDVDGTSASGIFGLDVAGPTLIDHVEVRDAGGSCLAVGGAVTGTFTLGDAADPDVVFDGSGLNALFFLSDGATLALGGVAIPNSGFNGIYAIDTHVTMDTCFLGERPLGAAGLITNYGVFVEEAGTACSLAMQDCRVTRSAVGVVASATAGAGLEVALLGTQFSLCGQGLIAVEGAGTADALRLAVGDCTFGPCAPSAKNVSVIGTVLDALYVTAFSDVTVEGNDAAGGVLFETVTFDADPGTAGAQTAPGGVVALGSAGGRIQGDGLRFDDPSGEYIIADLDIFNDSGTGLFIDTKGAGTTFVFFAMSGFIDTTNGSAGFFDPPAGMPPLTLDVTFEALRGGAAGVPAVIVDNVVGRLHVRQPVQGEVVLRNADGLQTNLR